jgi:hypothetical protein
MQTSVSMPRVRSSTMTARVREPVARAARSSPGRRARGRHPRPDHGDDQPCSSHFGSVSTSSPAWAADAKLPPFRGSASMSAGVQGRVGAGGSSTGRAQV